jgi:hypothetical protein
MALRWLPIVSVLLACSTSKPARQLDLDAITVPGAANLRTDKIGDGKFEATATFVLVDAENTTREGAYVTLGGQLTKSSGSVIGELKPQSLWIPAGERRTFALIDEQRVPRPDAYAARIVVRGALVPDEPPRAWVEDIHSFDDHGKTVLQGRLVNSADRIGQIIVLASFYDVAGQPMTRPFQLIEIDKKQTKVVQFVGPAGSKRGTMFVGDTVY